MQNPAESSENGKSASPDFSVNETTWSPSACMLSISSTIGLMNDLEASPMWWRTEAITSPAVSERPFWNSTPFRSRKIQRAASGDDSQLSARDGVTFMSASISVSVFVIA